MALTCGFFNSFLVNGVHDRKYNADDYTNVFSAFLKDGVRRSGLDDFKVSASGLQVTVGLGYAICGGRWVRLDADYALGTITPPVGDYSRIDAIVLRVDATEAKRAPSLLIRSGTAASSPVAPGKVTSTGITELILATIRVAPGASSVTVTDTRANANLCGWVTSPVGYDDFFDPYDGMMNDRLRDYDVEWQGMKDRWASVTLFKRYEWRTVLEASANTVIFDIPQYDSTGVDILDVYVNGLREVAGVDYTVSGSVITFSTGGGGTGTKVAGTEIVVICYKSIDGTGLGTVSDEITALQNQVSVLANANDYIYICNGVNDNVRLSQIAAAWLSGGTDYGSKIVRVYGTFGAMAPNSGGGTESNNYRWFDLGKGSATNRSITFDFTGCSQININCEDGTHNVIFFGMHVNVVGVNIIATGGAAIYMFSTAAGTVVNAEKSRFWITSQAGRISRGGTFRDCRTSLTTTGGDALAFNVLNGGILRLFGGEHYAYAPSDNQSAVVYVHSGQSGAVALTYGINCPTAARSGYVQTYAVNCLTNDACCSFTDTITALAIAAEGQNIRGTIKVSRAGLM